MTTNPVVEDGGQDGVDAVDAVDVIDVIDAVDAVDVVDVVDAVDGVDAVDAVDAVDVVDVIDVIDAVDVVDAVDGVDAVDAVDVIDVVDAVDAGVLCYSEDDLDARSGTNSEFDIALRNRWDAAMQKGFFRYSMGQLETRVVAGKHGFVAQLNVLRGIERRKPQSIASVSMPFQHEQFNFTKVHPREVLMYLVPRHRQGSETKNAVLINVSPLEYGNVLLVPDLDGCWPQVPTEDAIRLAIEAMMLSRNRALRMGFNGLCALASVNHLHFHAYYLEHPLRLEHVAVHHVAGQLFELRDHPARAFAFQVTQPSDIESVSRLVRDVSQFLIKNEVAHNMFMTKGESFEEPHREVLRIFLWPRKSLFGAKVEDAFNVACCELAGHLPIKGSSAFASLTEDDVIKTIGGEVPDEEEFEKLKLQFLSESC